MSRGTVDVQCPCWRMALSSQCWMKSRVLDEMGQWASRNVNKTVTGQKRGRGMAWGWGGRGTAHLSWVVARGKCIPLLPVRRPSCRLLSIHKRRPHESSFSPCPRDAHVSSAKDTPRSVREGTAPTAP